MTNEQKPGEGFRETRSLTAEETDAVSGGSLANTKLVSQMLSDISKAMAEMTQGIARNLR